MRLWTPATAPGTAADWVQVYIEFDAFYQLLANTTIHRLQCHSTTPSSRIPILQLVLMSCVRLHLSTMYISTQSPSNSLELKGTSRNAPSYREGRLDFNVFLSGERDLGAVA